MTATEEMVVDQRIQEEINRFVMPRPQSGQTILWYRHGRRLDGKHGVPEVAYVLSVGNKTLKIRIADGMVINAVPHIQDPRLTLNEHQRAAGAWDFTEEHNFFVNTARDILVRVSELESRLSEICKELDAAKPKKIKGNANEIL